jgi:hypothetical protein
MAFVAYTLQSDGCQQVPEEAIDVANDPPFGLAGFCAGVLTPALIQAA